MKTAMFLLMCGVAMMMLASCEGGWGIRRVLRRIRIRIRVPRINPRCYAGCQGRCRVGCRLFSAGQKNSQQENTPDVAKFSLETDVCKTWEARNVAECQMEKAVCQVNCTGCDPSGVKCQPEVTCPYKCCFCNEGEVLKQWAAQEEADVQDHVGRWLDKMGVKDEQDREELMEGLLGDGREEAEQPGEGQDDGVNPPDDNDKVEGEDMKGKDEK